MREREGGGEEQWRARVREKQRWWKRERERQSEREVFRERSLD